LPLRRDASLPFEWDLFVSRLFERAGYFAQTTTGLLAPPSQVAPIVPIM
jgi:hypothetical protein